MNQYQEEIKKLEKKKCDECGGLGVLDDASPYDISYNSWECGGCKGTGMKAANAQPFYKECRNSNEFSTRLR